MTSTPTALFHGVRRNSRTATALIIVAAALVVIGSYGFLVAVNRGSARFYLGNVVVFAIALVPYLLCAVIWLRTRSKSRAGELAGITTSGLLLLFALASSAWRITTDSWGGDMQGLFVFLEACVVSFGVIVISLFSYWIWRIAENEPQLSIREN